MSVVKHRTDYDHRQCSLKPNATIGTKYAVVRKLGKGAFCTVYHVNDNGADFACKVYRNGYTTREYFDSEVKILKRIYNNKPKTPTYTMGYHGIFAHLQYDEVNNSSSVHPCILVELLGDSLSVLIDDEPEGVDISVTKRIVRQILTGLKFLHANNIAHGDLKSSNILMTKRLCDINNRNAIDIRIADFNHSVFTEDTEVHTAGTQEYCSPEVLLKMKWDTSADIWSVGCIMYELLTACQLFTLDDDEDESETESGSQSEEKSNSDSESESYSYSECSEDERYEWDTNYSHFGAMYQLLGRPPRQFIKGGRDFFNSKGHLKHNPDIKNFNLRKHMVTEFEYSKRIANEICDYLFNMIKYIPSERATAERLLAHKFIK